MAWQDSDKGPMPREHEERVTGVNINIDPEDIMGFLEKIRMWFAKEEVKLAAEVKQAVVWLKPKLEAYAHNLERVFAHQAELFLEQAGPLIAQAAVQAIDSGLSKTQVRDFIKDALVPVAKSLAVDSMHRALDSVVNTTIELNHQEDVIHYS